MAEGKKLERLDKGGEKISLENIPIEKEEPDINIPWEIPEGVSTIFFPADYIRKFHFERGRPLMIKELNRHTLVTLLTITAPLALDSFRDDFIEMNVDLSSNTRRSLEAFFASFYPRIGKGEFNEKSSLIMGIKVFRSTPIKAPA